MKQIETGDFLFVHYGYDDDELEPLLTFLPKNSEAFEYLKPRNNKITLKFDTSQRYCVGWHDLETSQSFPCPDIAATPKEYEQCHHCRNKTGFNPAFYNASNISEQQRKRNSQPHSLYIAHFGPNVLKVGITWAGRGIKRLLDQGARSAMVIKTYPNADIARQYEAKIAKLPGIAETLQVRAKNLLLDKPYDADLGKIELQNTLDRLNQELGLNIQDAEHHSLDSYYLGDNPLKPGEITHIDKDKIISGRCIGMIGSTLIAEQDGVQFALPLSKLKGYRVTSSNQEERLTQAPKQMSFF